MQRCPRSRYAFCVDARGLVLALALSVGALMGSNAARAASPGVEPTPVAAQTQTQPQTSTAQGPAPPLADPTAARNARLARINAVKSWGMQLLGLSISRAARAPYDLLVVDATHGLSVNRHFLPAEVERLKEKRDGTKRLVLSYFSIGEAEDYRPDQFTPEYLTEDAPDWFGPENKQWNGNRSIAFCHKGWQATLLGDEDGRSVYNSVDPSPLYRLIELGFDGVYIDGADIYKSAASARQCPDPARQMVEFITQLATHARRLKPEFLVILQNGEDLLQAPSLLDTIDAIAKERLFYGADMGRGRQPDTVVNAALGSLRKARAAGRPVFVVDYVLPADAKADVLARAARERFIPYIGPQDRGKLWLPGREF